MSWLPFLALAPLLAAAPLGSEEAGDSDWEAIRPADLASITPMVQPGADAEVLFWTVRVEDKLATFGFQSESWNYIRIKVFTERGCESQAAVNLRCLWNASIDDVAGRTIHADGKIVRLRPEDIHVRTLVKVGRRRQRVTSFVLPAVTPGSIIEYHWHETRKGELADYGRLEFQRDIPVRQVTYIIRPLSVQGEKFAVKTRMFNAAETPIAKSADGELTVTMSNLPAALEESFAPPLAEVRPWLLYFYAELEKGALPVWAKQLFADQESGFKPSRSVRDTARRLVLGARDGQDSLLRLYSFCQGKVRNASEGGSGLLQSEIEALGDNAPADETLRRLAGTANAINTLFSILARAVGFQARVALAGDAADVFPATQTTSRSFFTSSVVAIPGRNGWRFFDPGSRAVPFGMLPWGKERGAILVPDAQAPAVVEPLPARAESSRLCRKASLRVGEDGSLDGEVRVERHGHLAIGERDERTGMSLAEWRKAVTASVEAAVGSAAVTDVRIDCPRDASRPCVYGFRMRLPGFAMVSGKRIILTPSVFQAGRPPHFPSEERKNAVVFPFSWSESDTVTFALPSSFALETPVPPATIDLCDGGRFAGRLTVNQAGDTLTWTRDLRLHGVTIKPREYPALRRAFRALEEVDNRMISVARGSSR